MPEWLVAPTPPGPHGGALTINAIEWTGEYEVIPAHREPVYFLWFVIGYRDVPERTEPVLDNRVTERWTEKGQRMGAWWWLTDYRRKYMGDTDA